MSTDNRSGEPGKLVAEDVWGTKYPYINLTESAVGTTLTNFRRSLGSLNPFALPQVPSQDRIAFGLRKGNNWYNPTPYPNGVVWGRMFPAHYDPLKDEPRQERWQVENFAPGGHGHLVLTADKLPRGCVREIQSYKRCEMINGKENCKQEGTEILKVCPTWALDELREKQRFLAKVAAINNIQYLRAMEVSPYNQGRTMQDVSDKTYLDGTRLRLRPDTMWADQRYSKITQAEINEAKKRMQERESKRLSHAAPHGEAGHHAEAGHHDEHHYDYKHIAIKHPKPLYP